MSILSILYLLLHFSYCELRDECRKCVLIGSCLVLSSLWNCLYFDWINVVSLRCYHTDRMGFVSETWIELPSSLIQRHLLRGGRSQEVCLKCALSTVVAFLYSVFKQHYINYIFFFLLPFYMYVFVRAEEI